MQKLSTTTIQFPEIHLETRAAHQLRGYFGRLFQDHSNLLHNHYDEQILAYRYPLVQYKVIDHIPTLVGIGEGASLLVELFLKIKELRLADKVYPILSKHISAQQQDIGLSDDLHAYQFKTLWMGLNQSNHARYQTLAEEDKQPFLKKILTANILAFYKGCGLYLQPEQRIMMHLQTKEKITKFKNKTMMAFEGSFTSNARLPDLIGLGKSTARGYGTITYTI